MDSKVVDGVDARELHADESDVAGALRIGVQLGAQQRRLGAQMRRVAQYLFGFAGKKATK